MSEMTMVERVAVAMEQAALDNQNLMAPGVPAREMTRIMARAAIAAMWEPTPAMEDRMYEVERPLADVWRTAIDEALREAAGEPEEGP